MNLLFSKISQILDKLIRKEEKLRLIPHFIVICIFTFLIAKVVFRSPTSNTILFTYGITVTSILFMTFTVAFIFYRDPYEKAMKEAKKLSKMADPLVSCMVAVFNEEKIIEQCVLSIVNQTYQNKEVIFVNDKSTDKTGKILDRLEKKYNFRTIHLKQNLGKKGALARACHEAKGDILAFSDSDSIWAPDAIEKIVPIFKHDSKVGAVSGHTLALNATKNLLTRVQDSWYEGQYSIRKAFESVFGCVTCVSGPLAVFRRESIYNYIPAWEHDKFLGQPFRFATDRTLTGFVLGSKYISKRIKKKYATSPFMSIDYPAQDWKIVYCKAAHAWTEVPDTFRGVIKQQTRWKKSFIRNIFFTGRFYWHKPLLPTLVYYLHIVFVVLGPFVVFRHLIYLPLNGNLYSMFLYLAGICFIGLMFGLAIKLEDPKSHRWIYRPLMSLFSTLVLSWLIFYSALTIRKMFWSRN